MIVPFCLCQRERANVQGQECDCGRCADDEGTFHGSRDVTSRTSRHLCATPYCASYVQCAKSTRLGKCRARRWASSRFGIAVFYLGWGLRIRSLRKLGSLTSHPGQLGDAFILSVYQSRLACSLHHSLVFHLSPVHWPRSSVRLSNRSDLPGTRPLAFPSYRKSSAHISTLFAPASASMHARNLHSHFESTMHIL